MGIAGMRGVGVEIRVLRAHNLESRDTRHTCMLIDSVLGLDAGSLPSALSAQEQAQILAVLLTHQHLDHIQGISTPGLATLSQHRSIGLYSLPATLEALHTHLMNGDLYPDLTNQFNGGPPKFQFHPVEAQVPLRVLKYQVKPISVPHPVPSVGFIIKSDTGGCFAHTGDAGGEILPFLQDSMAAQVLFCDVTFPSSHGDLAHLTGHLTPWILREQLVAALRDNLRLPRAVAVHLSAEHREKVEEELGDLAAELGVDLAVAHEGMAVEV